jgi:GNAT superfamily N-acetyltransferase
MHSIIEANSSHITAMAELLQYLFEQEADFNPNIEIQKQGLKMILENPDFGKVFVACVGDKVVGMVNVLFTISTAVGGKVAILEDMVVEPAYRNKGIGSALLNYASNFAFENDCLRITLLTDIENEKAHSFYHQKGFKLSAMVPFRKMA